MSHLHDPFAPTDPLTVPGTPTLPRGAPVYPEQGNPGTPMLLPNTPLDQTTYVQDVVAPPMIMHIDDLQRIENIGGV